MYLKNLTVLGFKSFADKTSLNFQRGITAIVGPNGCGKSNVADAIRWVLGEQSAKALRGGEMADVIFNGTDSRKQLGLAEVSLTIGDVDTEQLRAAGVAIDYNEVTITRRVFRDGGSEYFLNKTPCRLKDIQQLFAGTGMGKTSYSIMAQGNITQLLSSKPEDRRMVFEEAAGITRFKAQKKEALRKLEQTEQNLLRVADLVREVKRQIGSLQRQAGKARRYKQLLAELQHLETQLARHQFDVLVQEIRVRETAAEEARTAIETTSAAVLKAEDELLQLRQHLAELEHEISAGQQRATELKGNADREENRIHFHEERLRELESQNARALAEIAQAEERKLAAENEVADLVERIRGAEARVAELRTLLEERRCALTAVEQELIEKQRTLRQAQSDAFAAAQTLSRVRNELTALDLQKEAHAVRIQKISAEKIQLEEERLRLEARITEFQANVEAEKAGVAAKRGTVEERQVRLRELQQEMQEAGRELDGITRRQAEVRSKLNVLEQLESSHEGFSSGALAALQGNGGVLGSLADRIRVPDGRHILAVEAALGHHLQLVLAEQPETACSILSDLTAGRKGRASIAALRWNDAVVGAPDTSAMASPDSGEAAVVSTDQALSTTPSAEDGTAMVDGALPAGVSRLIDVVDAEESVRPLLRGLLGRTLLAPTLDVASAARRQTGESYDYVTETGELLSRHGVFTGGAGNGNGKPSSSILARKNQITELRAQATQLADEVETASRRRGALQAEQTELQAGLQEAQTELRAQEVAVATHQGEFNALVNSRRILEQRVDAVVFEIESLAAQEREGAEKREALAQRLVAAEAAESEAQQRVTAQTGELEGLRLSRDEANAALTDAKVTFASEEQSLSGLARQRAPLEQRIREMGALVEQRRAECGGFLQRKAQSETDIVAARASIERLTHEREVVNGQIAELGSRRDQQEADIQGREARLRESRAGLAEQQARRGQLEIELAQRRMSVENLKERIQQKYQIALEDIRSECITITMAEEGPPRVHVATPEEMAASGGATDWNAVSEQVAAMQKRLDEMGPVNLVAIEEYEEAEQRYNFLSAQHDDLAKAKEQLLEVIQRINTETRAMFAETFEKIRENFRGLFVEIFGGGHADLQLAEAEDVLESGIEIMARPPGKQLRSISLLSGGEQTMTAVALLFAIYQVKPSPFAVLDELDAPLDESNINRFIRVLQRFLERSQFIIITHNKRTIGMADVLYGVTMQEQGVSRIVSVKFHKVEEKVEHSTPLVPPAAVPDVEKEEEKTQSREDTIEVMMAK
ncbi:MAG: chromosome segregation protein SMC [Verrucomicrobiales bacterium]|nr:chromosome segregation protein SMC [Verrucomicrobiales bacterium]